MNKLTNLKALLLFAFFALFLLNPASLNAQKSDGFFRGGNDNYDNRTSGITINDEGGINNYGIGETVPLGSGLIILTAIGAGYAIARRKRSRRDTSNVSKYGTLLLAFALILSMTNCKKKADTISNPAVVEGVHITLDVCGDDGSKVVVTPGYENPVTHEVYANVKYEDGDIIYVGYNNNYVGYLTYTSTVENTGYFSGDVSIAAPVGEQPLHFYLLGGKGFTPTIDGNIATVVISDQSEQYPVISYYHSNEPYTGSGAYTSKLRNKCSIMKFNVVTESTSPICIMGMNNKVTVDFTTPNGTDNGFSYSKYQNIGEIKMMAGAGTRWAIVLPQPALSAGTHEAYTSIAEVMASNEDYLTGTRCAIPEIGRNQYLSDATNRTITVNETPSFTVNEDGLKVLFAPANLQATTDDDWDTWNWSFMEHQYSYSVDEGLNDEIWDDDYDTYRYASDAHVTMFKWGANGLSGGEKPYNITAKDSKYKANLTSAQDWGVPANAANLGGHNNWRTPSMGEWSYVASRKILDNKDAYGFAVIDKMKGFILLPDNWNGAIDPDFVYGFVEGQTNVYTAESWESMEAAGVVFLPAAGYRAAVLMTEFWLVGTYWSTNYGGIQYDESNHVDRTCAYAFTFNYHGQGYDGDVYEYVDDGDFYTPGLTSANYDSYTIPSWTTTDWRTWIYPTHNPQPGSYTPDPRPAPDPDGWEEDNDFTYYASSVRLIRDIE